MTNNLIEMFVSCQLHRYVYIVIVVTNGLHALLSPTIFKSESQLYVDT